MNLDKESMILDVRTAIENIEVEYTIDLTEFKYDHFLASVVKLCYEEARRVAQKQHDAKASDFISEMTLRALKERGAIE